MSTGSIDAVYKNGTFIRADSRFSLVLKKKWDYFEYMKIFWMFFREMGQNCGL